MIEFKEGQVWSYRTRPQEPESTLQILRIEKYENDWEVIHICVHGLKMENAENPDSPFHEISHMPFSPDALKECVESVVGHSDLPDFHEGYDAWKEEHDKGNAGAFTVSVGETVEMMEETLKSGDMVDEE